MPPARKLAATARTASSCPSTTEVLVSPRFPLRGGSLMPYSLRGAAIATVANSNSKTY